MAKNDDFGITLKEEIKEIILRQAAPQFINEDVKEDKAMELGKFCKFLRNYKANFEKYQRLIKAHYDEGEIRFNTYDLYAKIDGENIYFSINELTNYIAIKDENYRKGKCLSKIAHDFKSPLKAIDKYC